MTAINAARVARAHRPRMLEHSTQGHRAPLFTLQWHLTHACDLDCLHCYDRTKLAAPTLDQALGVLDQMDAFCEAKGVTPSTCFSGGNPFLYKPFFDVYASAVERGHRVSILGNPVSDEQLDRLCAIRKPRYFQVSLEGLEAHNDHIRGAGFYERVMEFLPKLRARGIQAVVMTTLTADNRDEVIPLARVLRDRADRYAYNRLAQVGSGAALAHLDAEAYGRFMIEWLHESQTNRTLGQKDNLLNIFKHELGMKLGGGCTGFGCGAAFNFVALLPDGAVHACRKFPSSIGNLRERSLLEIYDGADAEAYRRGCTACDGCAIRKRCGGCMAVSHGAGLDPFTDRDPHCFMYA